ncbi:site-2 protease family protein [Zunongwangia profunda]|jgi:hypothetical protein|uniref:site-2 protease family protein n=1 Tax=Zunongwangia profunda TaxID=398743 RepID=UPI000C8E5F95|nr:site-2 protease family protein [Zunongwangia profunda]MAG89098.1 hypothetical protein [Flavobacteriaceae bacterium]MCC4229525.1 site-2 protease family protein [Zunongwangia profunda]|tara:strand:+ start:1562 stop:2242 length:681 start_codon:yes stop_codon:yes gene_type:complete
MIEFWDLLKLCLAFFVIMPAISVFHEFGHVIAAKILGAKNIKIIIGSGKIIFNSKYIELRKYYFYYGYCYFENIDDKSKWRNLFIYSGGAIGNIMIALSLMYAIKNEMLTSSIFTYQFLYFSLYYIFFALFPMSYPDGNYSDGKIIYHLIKDSHKLIRQHLFQLRFNDKQKKWVLSSEGEEQLEEWKEYDSAYKNSLTMARSKRPSRLEILKEENTQVEIFPRNPI